MTVELLPCPLCGGRAEIWRAHPGTSRKAWIACVDRCLVLTKEHDTDAEAIAAWNTRPRSVLGEDDLEWLRFYLEACLSGVHP